MKKIQSVIGIIAMLLLIFAILITSFQIAIYGDPQYRFYEKEYEKYNVLDSLNMEMEDVMDVTDKMMAYLIDELPELSVVTMVDGKEQDFFNEQDRLHMYDVQGLFLGGFRLRAIALGIFAVLMIFLAATKAEMKTLLAKSYYKALAVSGVTVAVLGVLIASNFYKVFVLFHEIFFSNDLWLFDPRTDYMIRMLPEGFFYDMVIRIGVIFIISLVLVGLLFWGIQKYLSRTNKQL